MCWVGKPTYTDRTQSSVPNAAATSVRIWAPGLDQGFVPQGLRFIDGTVYVGAYRSDDPGRGTSRCRTYRVDPRNGAVAGTLDLPPQGGHAGGRLQAMARLEHILSGALPAGRNQAALSSERNCTKRHTITPMIRVTTFAGQKVAVFGLGKSGLASCRALMAGGASVVAGDDSTAGRDAAAGIGVAVEDLARADWSCFAALVLAPGVPLTHPEPHWVVRKARAAGVEIIGDVELYARERGRRAPDAPFVAITGTNGKSTTTALTAHILKSAGRDVQMGGNIGTAVLALEPPQPGRCHVIEMSSFQIGLTPTLQPTVGILLNVTPDHLDRHGTMEAYAALKARLVQEAQHPVLGDDDDWCRDISERLRLASRTWVDIVSAQSRVRHGWYATGSTLVSGAPWTGPAGDFADLAGIGSLRGRHNVQNALAASAAAMHLGVRAPEVAAALKTFPGLPHRLEEIGRIGRALFINDSKATNADSAATALAAFDRDILWIVGGRPKQGGIASLTPFFPRIARAYLIGEATEEFAATLDGRVPFVRCGTLDNAVAAASADAAASDAPQPVVLLSPACASFDHYRNFEVRGDAFRALAAALPGIDLRGGREA
jgi:UDP-N-acetylmuramoylalanine--D-glutamate ligase